MGKMKPSKALARKELRKAHRQAAKEKKQQRHAKRAALKTTADVTGEKRKILASTAVDKSPSGAKKRKEEDGPKSRGGVGGNGSSRSGGGRKKRWKPDEIDPMIAAEDAEIKRLERLLGITGTNAKKKRTKLEKELEQEDGLGDDFGAFLAGLDRIGEVVEGGASGTSDDGGVDADWDFHENVSGDSGSGSNGEGDKHSVPRGEGGLQGYEEADSEDVLESDEEEEEQGDEGGKDVSGREGAYKTQDRANDADEGLEKKGREKELKAGNRKREGRKGDWDAELEGDDDEEDEDDEGGDDGEEHSDDDGEEEKNSDDGDYDYEDDLEDGEYQQQHQTLQAEKKRVRKEEGVGDARANRTQSYGEDDNDEERDDGDGSEEFKLHTYRPTPGQDIYGRPIDKVNAGAAPAKYVPPHLRASAACGKDADSGKRQQVQRVVNGIMNRLSEETLEPVTARLKDAYRGHSTTVVNEALWQSTKAVCVHPKQVMNTLIPPFAAVIAALNISLGADVGGFFLETIARELNSELSGETRAGGRGTGSNLLFLLAYLYNYGVVHCSLVYDIIHLLVEAFGPKEMELLLLLLQHSGYQLRSDDPQAMKQIVAIVKDKYIANTTTSASAVCVSSCPSADADAHTKSLAEDTERWKVAFGSRVSPSNPSEMQSSGDGTGAAVPGDDPSAAGGSRARYILDTIVELQGNKRSRLREQGQESGRRVRKWLGSVKAAKTGGGGAGGDASLRVSWAELVSTETRGRWWKVGAAWTGRGSASENGAGRETSNVVASIGGGAGGAGSVEGDDEVGLLTLAARQRMNTDVRRSVFVAIMGSSDCEDALEKILRLNLKGAQEREIARVIIECCSQERSYNPFYAHLAERVCDRQPKLRFTFQVACWDALKALDEEAEQRASSLAHLMAHLVLRKQLSLTVLKTVEIPELNPSGLLLVRVFFQEIIAAGDDASFMEVFRRLARPSGVKEAGGHAAARDNTLVFLRGHLGSAPASWDHDKKKAFRKRVKGACRLIEAIVTAEELG